MNWLRRLFGHHVCGPFTPWVAKSANYEATHQDVVGVRIPLSEPLVYTRSWQERACTVCGKVEQEEMRY